MSNSTSIATQVTSNYFSTNSSNNPNNSPPLKTNKNNHQPPLPIRIALVSSTTALATPSFPALGFLYLVLRITVPDAQLRKSMEGSWGTLLSFCTWTLLPKLYSGSVASLILPCAMGNAIVAGGVYGLVDLACGGPANHSAIAMKNGGLTNDPKKELQQKILKTPWISGAGIGATTGYLAPHYMYGPVMEYVYGMEGMAQSIQFVMGVPYATEVSVMTGAIAGTVLHPLLYYPMNGIHGLHWGHYSGAALALVSSALYYVYYGQEGAGLPVPTGSFIDRSNLDAVNSILRYNNITGEVEAYSLKSSKFVGSSDACIEGRLLAESSRVYSKSGKVVFDDRLLAFVYNFWDSNAKSRYPEHIVRLNPKLEFQKTQDSMAVTDAAVATVLHRTDDNLNKTEASSRRHPKASADLTKVLKKIEDMNKNRIDGREQSPVKMDSLGEVCVAIELLMALKTLSYNQSHNPHREEIPKMEKYIRNCYPQITLYASDEKYQGESVESQLQAACWRVPDIAGALHRWKDVHEQEVYRTWRNRFLIVTTGLILSVGGSLLFSR